MSITIKSNIPKALTANEIANEKGIYELCVNIQNEAKVLAPVDKGQLRNSIMTKTTFGEDGFNNGGGELATDKLTVSPTKDVGYVGSNVNHAIYQEFGTRNQSPQPFLRPAGLIAKDPSQVDKIIKIFNVEMDKKLPKF